MLEFIVQQGNQLFVETSFIIRLLTLFSYKRQVIIDADNEMVSLNTKILYIFNPKTEIKFDDLWYVEYEYTESQTKHGSTDYYILSLVTRKEKKYHVCTMKGMEQSHLGLGINMADGSDDESRELVNILSDMIGIPIGKPIAEDMQKKNCISCEREISAISPKCLYCGALQNQEE